MLTDIETMMNQAPDEPPLRFAETVLDFESKHPGRGRVPDGAYCLYPQF